MTEKQNPQVPPRPPPKEPDPKLLAQQLVENLNTNVVNGTSTG